jgi:Flp pilus assembly pilin Flp
MRALLEETGQDLIEYVLLVFVVGLAVTTGMPSVAINVSAAYSNIGSAVIDYISNGNSANPSNNGNRNGHGQGNNGNNNGNGNTGDNGYGTGNGNNGKGKG